MSRSFRRPALFPRRGRPSSCRQVSLPAEPRAARPSPAQASMTRAAWSGHGSACASEVGHNFLPTNWSLVGRCQPPSSPSSTLEDAAGVTDSEDTATPKTLRLRRHCDSEDTATPKTLRLRRHCDSEDTGSCALVPRIVCCMPEPTGPGSTKLTLPDRERTVWNFHYVEEGHADESCGLSP